MKHLIALLIVGIAVTGASFGAADAAPKKGATKSLDPAKGYFHQLHVQKMTMTCATCHSSETRDILFLRKDDVVPAAMPGQVDRHVCLTCHQAPGKPTWYGAPAR
jgi:cytochrome c553